MAVIAGCHTLDYCVLRSRVSAYVADQSDKRRISVRYVARRCGDGSMVALDYCNIPTRKRHAHSVQHVCRASSWASLERVIGGPRFAAIYFMSALGGSVAALWFSGLDTISVGASGAVFGLMTATIVVGRRMSIDTSQIIFWLGLNVLIGFLAPDIDWRAHLGGAVVGAITAYALLGSARTAQKQATRWLTVGLIFVTLIVEILVRNQQILTYLGR